MKRVFSGFVLGVVLTTSLLLSVVAFAQEEILSLVRPLVVDVRQTVPIVADVIVPLEDGERVTATVPLTLDIALQIGVTGVVAESVEVVEETEPEVTVEAVAPVKQAAASSIDTLSLVAYNELPALDPGIEGELSVIKAGRFQGSSSTTVPVIVRNNTNETVYRIGISAIAYDADGAMLAIGSAQEFTPNEVGPGELSLGYVYFSDVELPEDATIEYEVTSEELDEFENIRDLVIQKHNLVGERIIGLLINQHDAGVTGPISVTAYCFDSDGELLDYFDDYTEKDQADSGETIPFQVDIELPCDHYLLAARGYAE
jgi:hypothetical protein